jgi:hypothetical protein
MSQAIPLLRDIFVDDSPRPAITLGQLAKSLNVSTERLLPLVRDGFIKAQSSSPWSSQSLVESPPEAALTWLRQWFMPVTAKPMFSLVDMADLLGVRPPRQVLVIAAAHNIPVTYDSTLGHMFSIWAAKSLLTKTLESKPSADSKRWDRQALLWKILEGDPARIAEPPTFKRKLEEEIERVAGLPEGERVVRVRSLIQAFRDVSKIATQLDIDAHELDKGVEAIRGAS